MTTPELVQFGELTPSHLSRHPVWVACHGLDEEESWYEETDEETFRPWAGSLPVDPGEGMLLARSTFQLADGTSIEGFATPASEGSGNDIGLVQPHVFLPDGTPAGFWLGMVGDAHAALDSLCGALGKSTSAIFPMSFKIEPGLALGYQSGSLLGIYTMPKMGSVQITK